jgi:hypothetical protein
MMRSVVDKDRTTLALALGSNQKCGDLTVELPRNIRLKRALQLMSQFQVKIDDKGIGYRIIK